MSTLALYELTLVPDPLPDLPRLEIVEDLGRPLAVRGAAPLSWPKEVRKLIERRPELIGIGVASYAREVGA